MAAHPIDPVRVYDVQRRARRRLFEWVRPLTQAQYTRPFPFGLATVQATLIEIAQTEFYLSTRLAAAPLPPVSEWPIAERLQPAFADLEAVWEPQMDRVRAIFERTTDWDRRITSEIRAPDRVVSVTATKADIATQLLLHDVHHRAQAMAILRQLGVPAQDLDYIGFVQERSVRPLEGA
jgi:uncharacterized damage-inducible protein DinB